MSDDVDELRDSAHRVLSDAGVGADENKTWSLIRELGWLLVCVPEDLGGLGQGLPAACALYREIGAHVAASPFLPAMLAIDAVSHGDGADKAAWVERLTTDGFATAALGRSSVRFATGRDGRLTGTASGVPSADAASHVLVHAPDDVVALVPLSASGVEISRQATWDTSRRLFDVWLSDVSLEAAHVLARGASAQSLARRLAAHREFALASDCVGGAASLLDMTIEYLQMRRQYRRPLALFQALKHRCADLKTHVSAADALLQDSLGKIGDAEDSHDVELKAMQAKALAAAVYSQVAEEAVQLHGGIAMTTEHRCHLFLKRALLNAHLGSESDASYREIAANALSAL